MNLYNKKHILKRTFYTISLFSFLFSFFVCASSETSQDEFDWLRDKTNPITSEKLLKFIDDENTKSNAFFGENNALLEEVFNEIKKRRPSATFLDWEDEHYLYGKGYEKEARYKTHYYTNKVSGKRSVLLDEQKRSDGHEEFKLLTHNVSPNGKFLAWVEDTRGNGNGTLYLKNLKNNDMIYQGLPKVSSSIRWSASSDYLYMVMKSDSGEQREVVSFNIHDKSSEVVYTEKDKSFFVYLTSSSLKDKVFINASTFEVDEVYSLSSGEKGEHRTELLVSRSLKSKFNFDFMHEYYYVKTNFLHENYNLTRTKNPQSKPESWFVVPKKDNNAFIKQYRLLNGYLAYIEVVNGIDSLELFDYKKSLVETVDFGQKDVGLSFSGQHQTPKSDVVRVRLESNITPMTVFDYEIKTKRLISKKVRFSGHNDKDYVYKRVMVPSKDGVKVPATIIYNKKYQNRHRPAHLYVYGAYGEGITPEFPSFALSLIDRGITYVIAHVRGGNELGKQWHEDGKFLKKKNSFYDFIAVADYLVSNNFVKKGNLSASGESAAGLVIGYAVNARPDLFKAITMLVPFVDALNSLMDESLPYTYFDKSEFGDPVNNQEYYDYIKSYAPFNNIQKHKYPHIYVTSGVNDIAVGYWEPMKWLAKIRKYQTNKSETYLAVHGGGHIQSGLHSVNMDFAKQIAFLLTMHDKE